MCLHAAHLQPIWAHRSEASCKVLLSIKVNPTTASYICIQASSLYFDNNNPYCYKTERTKRCALTPELSPKPDTALGIVPATRRSKSQSCTVPHSAGLKRMPRRTKRVLKKAIRATERAEGQVTALYTPLITERKEIRLVTLCSGSFGDDIMCSLSKVSLDDKPSYEALSYVWGDRRITRRIFIDGLSRRVTRNLEIALRHLR